MKYRISLSSIHAYFLWIHADTIQGQILLLGHVRMRFRVSNKSGSFSTTRHQSSSLLFHVSMSPRVHYICGHGADIIQRRVLFHSAQAIAWTLFKSGYFSMCGYYSRKYGTMNYMYNMLSPSMYMYNGNYYNPNNLVNSSLILYVGFWSCD